MLKHTRRKSERGATTTEVALLLASMVVIIIGTAAHVGNASSGQFAAAEVALAFDDTELAGECRNDTWTLVPTSHKARNGDRLDSNGDGMLCHKVVIRDGSERLRYRDNDS